jgi:hypothetical protein
MLQYIFHLFRQLNTAYVFTSITYAVSVLGGTHAATSLSRREAALRAIR